MTQTPVIVQRKLFATANVTDGGVTLDSTPVEGNCLIVAGKENSLGTITLTGGFTHATDGVTSSPYNGGVSRQLVVAYKVAGAGESTSFNWHTDSTANKEYELYEVSGLGAVPDIDVVIGSASAGSATSRQLTTTGTLAQASNIVFAMCDQATNNGGEVSVDSGFTLRDTASFSLGMYADKITSATTALAPTYVWTTARGSFGLTVVFKGAVDVPAAPVISSPTEAQVLATAGFDISGTAESGSTVTVYDASDDSVVDTAVATGGNWSITLAGQVDGSYAVYATATNNGGEGTASADRSYSVDTSGGGGSPGTVGDPLVKSLNRIAGTTGLDAAGAANAYAGTSGLGLVGALNVAAGNTLPAYKELQGVLNQLAGTTGLGVDAAAAAIEA